MSSPVRQELNWVSNKKIISAAKLTRNFSNLETRQCSESFKVLTHCCFEFNLGHLLVFLFWRKNNKVLVLLCADSEIITVTIVYPAPHFLPRHWLKDKYYRKHLQRPWNNLWNSHKMTWHTYHRYFTDELYKWAIKTLRKLALSYVIWVNRVTFTSFYKLQ